MSAANWRRMIVTGALPGRNPGMRATRAMSRAAFSLAFDTFAAGISSSISRLQVAAAASVMEKLKSSRETTRKSISALCLSGLLEKERAGNRASSACPTQSNSIGKERGCVNFCGAADQSCASESPKVKWATNLKSSCAGGLVFLIFDSRDFQWPFHSGSTNAQDLSKGQPGMRRDIAPKERYKKGN